MKMYPKYGLSQVWKLLAPLFGVMAFGLFSLSADQKSPVEVFMPAGAVGDVPGDLLIPGESIFPASDEAYGRLKRQKDRLEVEIKTDGLPAGTYTVWWVAFNDPSKCTDGLCDMMDLFTNPAVKPAVFFATGAIVEDEGGGLGSACFRDVHFVGEYRGAPIQNDVMGPNNELDPMNAEIHMIIKYHGPPIGIGSSGNPIADSYELHDQTSTLLGNCQNANGFTAPNGIVQCFDPQMVIFPAPNNKPKK